MSYEGLSARSGGRRRTQGHQIIEEADPWKGWRDTIDQEEEKMVNKEKKPVRAMKAVMGSCLSIMGICWWLAGEPLPAHAQAAKGKSLYERHCLACHGVGGKGDGPTGKMVVPPAADLTAPENSKKTDAEWLSIIENGKPGTAMVGFKGQLSNADLRELLAYIRTFSK